MPPVLGVRQHRSTTHLLLHSKATAVRQQTAAQAPGFPKPNFLPFPRGKPPAAGTSEHCYGSRQSLADFSPPYTAAAPSHSRALATAAPAAEASPGHPRGDGSGAAPCGPPGASSPPPGDKSETRGRGRGRGPPSRRCPPPARPLPAGLGAAAPAREEPGPGEGRPPARPYPRVCG